MAFTYADLTQNRERVRLFLGDTTEDKGPFPNKSNFSDAEIDYFLTTQGNGINRSVAMGLEVLGNVWLAYSLAEREGDVSYDAKGLADAFFKRASVLWTTPDGESSGGLTAGVLTYDFAEHGGDWPTG